MTTTEQAMTRRLRRSQLNAEQAKLILRRGRELFGDPAKDSVTGGLNADQNLRFDETSVGGSIQPEATSDRAAEKSERPDRGS